jgi:hypothetical protein
MFEKGVVGRAVLNLRGCGRIVDIRILGFL